MIPFFSLLLAFALPQAGDERHALQGREPVHAPFPAGDELWLHDVAHLTGHARLAALIARLARSAEPSVESAREVLEALQARREEVEATTESLLNTVREMIQPALAAGQCVQHVERGNIALLGSAPQQAWLTDFLAQAAAFHGLLDIQTRIQVVPRSRLPASPALQSGRILAPDEIRELLVDLESWSRESVVAPRVLVFPFQESRLAMVDQVAYVKDFEVKVLPNRETVIADPVIDVAENGVHLRLRGVPLAGERLSVYAHLEYASLAQPIPSIQTTVLGREVTIERPEITKVAVEGRFELRSGETLLLRTILRPAQDEEVLVLVKATRVEEVPPGEDR